MDDNMDDNIVPADQSQAFLQRAQSQSTSISPLPALESGRQRTFLFFLKTSHTPFQVSLYVYRIQIWQIDVLPQYWPKLGRRPKD